MNLDRSLLRLPVLGALAAVMAIGGGCRQSAKRTPAQEAGDAFVDHYLHADQEGALPFAALGAESQLKTEMAAVKDARDEASPDIHVTWKRTAEEARGQRVVLVYEVDPVEKSPPRTMRLEVTDLGQGPKVVLYELR